MKDFIGSESCFRRSRVTPPGAPLSETVSKENNRSYSSQLWAWVQTQTTAETKPEHCVGTQPGDTSATIPDLSIAARSLSEHVSSQFTALRTSRIEQRWQGAAEHAGSCSGRGTVAAGDVATYQEPFVRRGLLIHAHVQIQGYSFWVKKPLSQRLLEAVLREGSRRYCNLHLAPGPPSCSWSLLEIRQCTRGSFCLPQYLSQS